MWTLVYVLVKCVAESAWCHRGLRVLHPAQSPRVVTSLGYGLGRLLIGRGMMILVSEVPSVSEPALYVGLVLLRWPIWSLLAELIARRRVHFRALLVGHDNISRRWQAGGIAVSCLTDVVALLGGFWVGHIWV